MAQQLRHSEPPQPAVLARRGKGVLQNAPALRWWPPRPPRLTLPWHPPSRRTCVAVAGNDYCIVAASTRMSTGYNILTRNSSMLMQL